ncbi:hypothetical protein K0M31_012228 [Melipona bicolor]|uniref:Uncharacterized protein n=1 Tax=Melipona bicolor TaxID=60889 RepID=A0AA40FK49_9HYME|nr:hypothetical protein K0M31_012228 [Melipona bicolor]
MLASTLKRAAVLAAVGGHFSEMRSLPGLKAVRAPSGAERLARARPDSGVSGQCYSR